MGRLGVYEACFARSLALLARLLCLLACFWAIELIVLLPVSLAQHGTDLTRCLLRKIQNVLVGWLVGWSLGSLVGRSVIWMVGCLVGLLVGCLVGLVVSRLVGWLLGD